MYVYIYTYIHTYIHIYSYIDREIRIRFSYERKMTFMIQDNLVIFFRSTVPSITRFIQNNFARATF